MQSNEIPARVENYEFVVFKAVAICIVVLGHKWGGEFEILSTWFPLYSFRMPLFFFISGYFFKDKYLTNFIYFIKRKIQTLMVPYFKWNLFYGILITILLTLGYVRYGQVLSISSFFWDPWVSGHQYALNVSTWFIPVLFLTHICYYFIRKIMYFIHADRPFLLMVILLGVGFTGTYMASIQYTEGLYLKIMHICFALPFYHLGYLYSAKLEKYDHFSIWIFLSILVLQHIIISHYGDITYVMVWGEFKNLIVVPFIVSATGLWVCLHFSKSLAKVFPANKLISYIGNNSIVILFHHQLVFFIINGLFFKFGDNEAIGFNANAYKEEYWYVFVYKGVRTSMFFQAVAGIAVPLLMKKMYDYLVKRYRPKKLLAS